MFTDLRYDERMKEAINAISGKGAFLTVTAKGTTNTMTIGWASIGYFWAKPILIVAVRDSRYTYELLQETAEFTVSIPFGALEEELRFCGTKSGRDRDKIAECQFTMEPGRTVKTPVIAQCDLHYECKILLRTAMNPQLFAEAYHKWYPKEDYHTFYFGEILSCYGRE